jgi:hypothetical protein
MMTIRKALIVCGALASSMSQCGDDSTPAMPAAPTLNSVSPASASNAGGGTLTLGGSGFQSGAAVTIGGLPCENPTITDTQITCTLPEDVGKCGAQAVEVTNPDSQTAVIHSFSYYGSAPSLGSAAAFTVGAGPQGLALGDINGD